MPRVIENPVSGNPAARRTAAADRTAAISTCGSRATAHGFIAGLRSTGCRWSSCSPPCCAARPTAAIGWSPRPNAAASGRGRAVHRGRGRPQRRGPRPAADLPHQSGRDCDGGAGPARCASRPLRTATPAPYILVRAGLEARLARPVFYELVDLGVEEQIAGEIAIRGMERRQVLSARRARTGLELEAIDARPGDRAVCAPFANRAARLRRHRRPGRGGGVSRGDARRPRSQPRDDAAQHRVAPGGGAGAADRPCRGHVGAADPAHARICRPMPGRSRFPAGASRPAMPTRSPPRCARPKRRSACRASRSA